MALLFRIFSFPVSLYMDKKALDLLYVSLALQLVLTVGLWIFVYHFAQSTRVKRRAKIVPANTAPANLKPLPPAKPSKPPIFGLPEFPPKTNAAKQNAPAVPSNSSAVSVNQASKQAQKQSPKKASNKALAQSPKLNQYEAYQDPYEAPWEDQYQDQYMSADSYQGTHKGPVSPPKQPPKQSPKKPSKQPSKQPQVLSSKNLPKQPVAMNQKQSVQRLNQSGPFK